MELSIIIRYKKWIKNINYKSNEILPSPNKYYPILKNNINIS